MLYLRILKIFFQQILGLRKRLLPLYPTCGGGFALVQASFLWRPRKKGTQNPRTIKKKNIYIFKISIFYNGNMLDFIEYFCSYPLNVIVLWCHFHCSHLTGDERGSHCLRVLKLRATGSVIRFYQSSVLFYLFSVFTFCFGSSGGHTDARQT